MNINFIAVFIILIVIYLLIHIIRYFYQNKNERILESFKDNAIQIKSATYGYNNCGSNGSNQTSNLSAACNDKSSCSYSIDHTRIGDPAPDCPKQYNYTWCCNSECKNVVEAGEASGKTINLRCEPPSPPAPNITYENSGSVYSMGTTGIDPWGDCPGFLDQSAQWIWFQDGTKPIYSNGSKKWKSNRAPANSGGVFYYNWNNDTNDYINIKINIIADAGCQIWVNSKYKGFQEGGAGGAGGIITATLIPGINNFQFRAQNYKDDFIVKGRFEQYNPAGILVSVLRQDNNQILFNSNSDWKYELITSNTSFTPRSCLNFYIMRYTNYCTGEVNGPIYIKSDSEQISDHNIEQNNCIMKCIQDDNCEIALMSDQNTCTLNKGSQNLYMYCVPQSVPDAQNYGNYILRNPRKINVGSSSRRRKVIRLPENNMIVSPIPENPQNYIWSEFFIVTVKGNKLYVTRSDANRGWSQKLILNAYSTANIKMFPQSSSSYVPMSDSKIDYYNTNNSYKGSLPICKTDFSDSSNKRISKWMDYNDINGYIDYPGIKGPDGNAYQSCEYRGTVIVNNNIKKKYNQVGWNYSPFMCQTNKLTTKYKVEKGCNQKITNNQGTTNNNQIVKNEEECIPPRSVNHFTLSSVADPSYLPLMNTMLNKGKNLYVSQGSERSGQVCYVDEENKKIVVQQLGQTISGGADVAWGQYQSSSLQGPLGTVSTASGGCPTVNNEKCNKAVLRNCGTPKKACQN